MLEISEHHLPWLNESDKARVNAKWFASMILPPDNFPVITLDEVTMVYIYYVR